MVSSDDEVKLAVAPCDSSEKKTVEVLFRTTTWCYRKLHLIIFILLNIQFLCQQNCFYSADLAHQTVDKRFPSTTTFLTFCSPQIFEG